MYCEIELTYLVHWPKAIYRILTKNADPVKIYITYRISLCLHILIRPENV